ncbi:MAG: NAD nucleotidase [Epsilonproteobacteria bacterium]|nr:NAD nucleotidase [Campylobacterota bacterium]
MKYTLSVVLSVALLTFSGCNNSTKKVETTPETQTEQTNAVTTLKDENFNYKITATTEEAATTNPQLMMVSYSSDPANQAPVCKITTDGTKINPTNGIGFSGLESSDVDGNIVSYKWTDMDGNVLSNEASFGRGFNYIGRYIKTLQVTDDKGATSSCSVTIDVTEPNHKAISTSLIHINDHHSHLTSETMSLYFNGEKTYTALGGFPRVVTKIKALQETETNPITLHAGDIIQGTLFYTLFKGEPDAVMMNQINWDAVTLGNHEFDDGDEGLKSLLDAMPDVPMISANVVPQAGNILENYWEPYRIIEREGERIGIIGLEIGQKTKVSSSPSDEIDFLDEITTTQKYVDALRKQGINKIILLSHFGMDNDLDLASKVNGVDIIIDGDSHSLMGDFSMVGLTSHFNEYPKETLSKSGEKVCVTSAWQYAYVVGNLKVDFDESGQVTKCEGTPYLLLGDSFQQKDATGAKVEVNATKKAEILTVINTNDQLDIVTEDADTLQKLDVYSNQIDEKKAEVVGAASEFLGHNRIPGDVKDGVSNLPLGSDIAPLVAKSFYDKSLRADVCIQNAGGVRVAIEQGDIDIEKAYTLLPFSNTLFEIDMRGSEIKQVLEDAITNFQDNGGSTGSFPYAYGIKYDVDLTQPANSRVSNIEVLDRTAQTWSAITPDTTYVVVTNDYIAAGRDGYTTFKTVQDARGEGVNTYYDYAMSFVDMVKALANAGQELSKLPADEHPIKSFNQ